MINMPCPITHPFGVHDSPKLTRLLMGCFFDYDFCFNREKEKKP